VTLEQAKNYKSLDSYRYFSCGWVLHTEWKLYSEEEIVLLLEKFDIAMPPQRILSSHGY